MFVMMNFRQLMLELVHYFDQLVTIPLSHANSLFSNTQTPLWQQPNFLEFVSLSFFRLFFFSGFWQRISKRILTWLWILLYFVHMFDFSQNTLKWIVTKVSQYFTMAISVHFTRCRKLHFKDHCCQLQSRNCTLSFLFFWLCSSRIIVNDSLFLSSFISGHSRGYLIVFHSCLSVRVFVWAVPIGSFKVTMIEYYNFVLFDSFLLSRFHIWR